MTNKVSFILGLATGVIGAYVFFKLKYEEAEYEVYEAEQDEIVHNTLRDRKNRDELDEIRERKLNVVTDVKDLAPEPPQMDRSDYDDVLEGSKEHVYFITEDEYNCEFKDNEKFEWTYNTYAAEFKDEDGNILSVHEIELNLPNDIVVQFEESENDLIFIRNLPRAIDIMIVMDRDEEEIARMEEEDGEENVDYSK